MACFSFLASKRAPSIELKQISWSSAMMVQCINILYQKWRESEAFNYAVSRVRRFRLKTKNKVKVWQIHCSNFGFNRRRTASVPNLWPSGEVSGSGEGAGLRANSWRSLWELLTSEKSLVMCSDVLGICRLPIFLTCNSRFPLVRGSHRLNDKASYLGLSLLRMAHLIHCQLTNFKHKCWEGIFKTGSYKQKMGTH